MWTEEDAVRTEGGVGLGHRRGRQPSLDRNARAASLVGADGHVTGVDISGEMLALAGERAAALGLRNVTFREGRAEAIPGDSGCCDVLLASLSLMYVIDRAAAAREIARILRPRGRFVAAVWAGPTDCDIVWLQQTAGSFAPPSPVPGVGPGALADPRSLLTQLAEVGVDAHVETQVLGFDFDDFETAWTILAGVTTAALAPERLEEAKAAVRVLMWPHGDGPRHFRNMTHFIVGASQPGQTSAFSASPVQPTARFRRPAASPRGPAQDAPRLTHRIPRTRRSRRAA